MSLLYPKQPLADAIQAKPELVGSLWKALKAIKSEALTGEGRVYGGGLYKMEPRELGNVSAESIVLALPTLPTLPITARPRHLCGSVIVARKTKLW